MASSSSSLASTAVAPNSPSAIAAKGAIDLRLCHPRHSNLSFRLSPKPKLRFFTKGSRPGHMLCPTVKAQLNEVAVDGSSNEAAASKTKSEVAEVSTKDTKPSSEPSFKGLATEESISQFIAQVASLVKLVDSRDIVELQLKQVDCEVIIKKKEALPQLQPPAQIRSPPSVAVAPVAPSSTPTPTAAPPIPTPSTSPPAVKSAKSSHPPLKSPMAGTFYRSPAPGEPPFVKVGDKVKKGQVLCIIEAMKLMNEIEADQTGTVVDILMEEGKSVSVDTPLFVIEP